MWGAHAEFIGVRVVNFVFGLFWAVHLVACGWYPYRNLRSVGHPAPQWDFNVVPIEVNVCSGLLNVFQMHLNTYVYTSIYSRTEF